MRPQLDSEAWGGIILVYLRRATFDVPHLMSVSVAHVEYGLMLSVL